MGAMITICYDADTVSVEDSTILSKGVRDLVAAVIGDSDVFVYADSAVVRVDVAPIEIFVQLNAANEPDSELVNKQLAARLAEWKSRSNFPHVINLNIMPVAWHSTIGI